MELPKGITVGVTVIATCPNCKQESAIDMPKAGYDAWQAGTLIQNALPQLSDDVREQLISGWCGPCFDKLCPTEDEEL